MMRTVLFLSSLLLIAVACVPSVACTSFVMDGPEGPIFGTNLDLFIPGDGLILVNLRGVHKATYQTGTTGERHNWRSEYGSVTFNLAGNEFAWGGMNEAGLVVSSMELRAGEYPEPDERPAFFDGNWTQYVLDMCATVDEAAASLTNLAVRDGNYTSHYLVADADGDAIAVEFLDGEQVVHSGEAMRVKAMANIRYERGLYAHEHGGRKWWWSNPGQSSERVSACQRRAEAFDAARDTSAVDYAFGTLLYYVAAPNTRWSIVFDVPSRVIHYRTDQSPIHKSISFENLDFTCGAGKRMLDVNTRHEGPVDGRFVPYVPAVNQNVFQTFCERYGINVSDEDARDLMGFYDAFTCTP
ncbi:MAG: linear amide C-N hydrolase [Candidatus Eisenbacteria bacterium]|nr:linear amide C-N hydrolase [Candidatus Eisenbacteria bacterium]